jgi:hypothetical protein
MLVPALLCPSCSEAWPKAKRYHHCPRCHTPTVLDVDATGLTGVEAEGLADAYDGFTVWLAKHENLEFPALDLSRFDVIGREAALELSSIPVLEEKAA